MFVSVEVWMSCLIIGDCQCDVVTLFPLKVGVCMRGSLL